MKFSWTIHGIWQFHWDIQECRWDIQNHFTRRLMIRLRIFWVDFSQKKVVNSLFFRSADFSPSQISSDILSFLDFSDSSDLFRFSLFKGKAMVPRPSPTNPQPWLQVDAARLSASEIVDALQQWLEAHGLEAGCRFRGNRRADWLDLPRISDKKKKTFLL